MSIISLKRYLTHEPDDVVRTILSLFLNAAADKAARADVEELAAFQKDIGHLRDLIGAPCPPDELLVHAGAAAHAIEAYNDRLTRLIQLQSTELHHMISMLTQAVVIIAGRSDQSLTALENVRGRLEKASRIEDVQNLKSQLRDCLKTVCSEAARQKAETAAVILELQQNIVHAKKAVIHGIIDRVTGLPLRAEAEAAFARELGTPGLKFVVTVVMDRLESINNRFGYEAGDQAFRALGEYVQENLVRNNGFLFRWSGPVLVAIVVRPETLEGMRAIAHQILDSRMQRTFEFHDRSAMISLGASWSVTPLVPPSDQISYAVQKFVDTQLPRQAA